MALRGDSAPARAATEPERRPWRERHHALWLAAKWAAASVGGLLIVGAITLGGWLVDLRDGVRDNSAATTEIRARVEGVEVEASASTAELRGRVRVVESAADRQTVALEWIVRSLERLERAAGTAGHAPPAPVLGPPEPISEPAP